MKNSKYNIWGLFVAILLVAGGLFTACSDDDDNTIKGVLPTVSAMTPVEALRPGDMVTIKGTDLDHVKYVRFGASYLLAKSHFISNTATQIEVAIPPQAPTGEVYLVPEDNVVPNVLAGTLTMVSPAMAEVSPLKMIPGDVLTITGTDLDLVAEVHIGTTAMKSMELINPARLEVVFAKDMATGGVLRVVTTNGEEIPFSSPIAVISGAIPQISSITPASVRPGQEITILGSDLDVVTNIIFDNEIDVIEFTKQTSNQLIVVVPEGVTEGATIPLELVAISGEIVKTTLVVKAPPTGTEPVDDPALVIFDFEDRDGNNSANNAGGWGGIANGKSTAGDGVSGDFFEITASNWSVSAYWWVADNWVEAPFPSISGISKYVLKMDIRLREDIPAGDAEVKMLLSESYTANILPYLLKDDVWTTGGEWRTITIPLSAFTGLTDPTPTDGNWGIVAGWNLDAINFTGFCIDNIRYELIK